MMKLKWLKFGFLKGWAWKAVERSWKSSSELLKKKIIFIDAHHKLSLCGFSKEFNLKNNKFYIKNLVGLIEVFVILPKKKNAERNEIIVFFFF